MSQLAQSFSDDSILEGYLNFITAEHAYLEEFGCLIEAKLEDKVYEGNDIAKWNSLTKSAGVFRHALREKTNLLKRIK